MSGTGTILDPWDIVTAFKSPKLSEGKTLYLRAGKYSGNFNPIFSGGSVFGGLIVRPYETEVVEINGNIHNGKNYTRFQELTINDDSNTERVIGVYGGESGYEVANKYNELRDCIISNCSGGIYIEDTADGVVIDGCIVYFNGWLDDGTLDGAPHGHGIYLHGGKTTIRNSIIFYNASNGIQVYGGVDHSNCVFQNNICFMTHELWSALPGLGMNYVLSVNAGAVLENNCSYSPINRRRANEITQVGDGILTNNYLIEGIYQYNPELWAEASGNVLAPEETNAVKVFDVRGRAHVAIYNWELLESVTVDLSTVAGFSVGDMITVISAIDFFADRVQARLDENKCITVDMLAISHTVASPQGIDSPATTFPEFGCFVIEKVRTE